MINTFILFPPSKACYFMLLPHPIVIRPTYSFYLCFGEMHCWIVRKNIKSQDRNPLALHVHVKYFIKYFAKICWLKTLPYYVLQDLVMRQCQQFAVLLGYILWRRTCSIWMKALHAKYFLNVTSVYEILFSNYNIWMKIDVRFITFIRS